MPTALMIPVKRCTPRRGWFRWPREVVLASEAAADRLPLGQLARDLAALGVRARVVRRASGAVAVRIRRETDARKLLGALADKPPVAPGISYEAYRIDIAPEGIEIGAASDAGAYYAVQTLRDLVAIHGRALPACRLDDAPDFARRGVYHDCSRGKVPTLATLRGLVEQLARWKVNELQLYVENVFRFRRHPAIGRGYSPLSAADLRALERHARLHHVRLVGSLASFGHLEKILQLPRYRRLGEWPGWGGWPGGTTLAPEDPESIRLIEDLNAEFVPLFPAADFNVCGDEPVELGLGRSRRRAERVGVGRVYLDFLRRLHRLCRRHGKRMNAWADIVLAHPDLLDRWPRDTVLLNWEYAVSGGRMKASRRIAAAGLAQVVCPGTNAWNSHGCRLAMGMANLRHFAAEGRRCGAEGLLNTDWGDFGHRNMLAVSLHNLAYGAACAWNGRAAGAAAFAQAFTRVFARTVFGARDGRLAAAIRTLGRADEALGLGPSNRTLLYDVFLGRTGPLLDTGHKSAGRLDGVSAAALAAHRRALGKLRWPRASTVPAGHASRFLADRLEEFALAARLDRLACRRAAALKQIRAGRRPRAKELRALAAETRRAARELARVWRLGNRPSRLREHLAAMREVEAEYRRMAR